MANADPARSRRYWKNNHHSVDSNKEFTFNQYILLIKSHQLTELLEALESVGIAGDLAIFVIASIQSLEALA